VLQACPYPLKLSLGLTPKKTMCWVEKAKSNKAIAHGLRAPSANYCSDLRQPLPHGRGSDSSAIPVKVQVGAAMSRAVVADWNGYFLTRPWFCTPFAANPQ